MGIYLISLFIFHIRLVDIPSDKPPGNLETSAGPGCRGVVASDHAQRWGFLKGPQDGTVAWKRRNFPD